MKIVALNIQHGGGKRIAQIADYLLSQHADVIVLTEFRDNANARTIEVALATQGFNHQAAPASLEGHNSVCIFATHPFSARGYPALSEGDRHRIVSAHFEGFGVVGVYFPLGRAKGSLFRFLLDGGLEPIEAAHIVVGDLNTGQHGLDENGATFHCADDFAALSSAGLIDSWRSRNPQKREFSWYSHAGNGFRIDHAFASATADRRIECVYYDHTTRESKISDHAALVVHAS